MFIELTFRSNTRKCCNRKCGIYIQSVDRISYIYDSKGRILLDIDKPNRLDKNKNNNINESNSKSYNNNNSYNYQVVKVGDHLVNIYELVTVRLKLWPAHTLPGAVSARIYKLPRMCYCGRITRTSSLNTQ